MQKVHVIHDVCLFNPVRGQVNRGRLYVVQRSFYWIQRNVIGGRSVYCCLNLRISSQDKSCVKWRCWSTRCCCCCFHDNQRPVTRGNWWFCGGLIKGRFDCVAIKETILYTHKHMRDKTTNGTDKSASFKEISVYGAVLYYDFGK